MTMNTTKTITLAILSMLATLVGCASTPERFYALSSPAGESTRASADGALGPTVVVAPAALPELIDRPQLVTFGDAHQVLILEQQRWAEPLRTAIPRVVADGLGRQLGPAQVSTRDEALRSPDCWVYLDVRRLDARREVAVDLEALWTVACKGGVGPSGRRSGRTTAHVPIRGPSTEAMVVAQGRALGVLTGDLAGALRASQPGASGSVISARGWR